MSRPDKRQGRQIEILMVDDDAGDVRITQVALRDAKVRNVVHVAKDGEEAMQFLRRQAPFSKAPRPDVVFLDLNMPRKNGFETLKEIRADPDLTDLPVVILTTSNADRDVLESYKLHANCFVSKPVELDAFLEVIHQIEEFWVSIVKLPPRRR